MKTSILIGTVAVSFLALAGCIHVSEGSYSDLDEIAANTETALRVCGGPGTVQEVTENGYTCIEHPN